LNLVSRSAWNGRFSNFSYKSGREGTKFKNVNSQKSGGSIGIRFQHIRGTSNFLRHRFIASVIMLRTALM